MKVRLRQSAWNGYQWCVKIYIIFNIICCCSRLKITDSRSLVMMTGQIFFSPDKPRFWPVKLMNIIITLLPMEYRITLAVRHCRSSFCRQVGEKFIHTLLSSFPRFSPVLCPFIYTFSIIVQRCRKSPRFVLYLHIGET